MKFLVWFFRCALAVILFACVTGCEPAGQSQLDEEKEPHFLEGMRALNSYDRTGAIDQFEKAVEADPANARAHFELGCLYEGNREGRDPDAKEADPAAAIYHYEQFLKLRPNADTADAVRQRIINCKQDLAKAVLPLPTTPGVQRDLEQLVTENKRLHAQLDQWQEYFKTMSNHPVAVTDSSGSIVQTQSVQMPLAQSNRWQSSSGGNSRTPSHAVAARTYLVQSRDTLASVSRKYNVKLDALVLANPGLDPRKLRVGQTLNIP